MSNQERKQWLKPAVWVAGMAAAAWALTGCGGWNAPKDSATAVVDLRPIAAQMNDQPAGSGYSAQSVSSPGNTATTTDVKAIIIGALVIAFTDTPIGPDTPITKDMQDNLTTAAKNSIKFIKIVQLPSPDPFVEFDLPPPEATHWEVVAVGTRDPIDVLSDVGDNSPIYYGFNVDANNKPFLLSGSDAPATVTVKLQRACIANTPPVGCAQYKPNRPLTAASLVITPSVEIVGVYLNGTSTNVLPGAVALVIHNSGAVAGAQTTVFGLLGTATSVRIDTTHQQSVPNATSNPTCAAATAGQLFGSAPGVAGAASTCKVESYTTSF